MNRAGYDFAAGVAYIEVRTVAVNAKLTYHRNNTLHSNYGSNYVVIMLL